MNSAIQIIFGLFGGLAIFIYGMNMMSECLQKAAGEKMKNILALLTRNPVLGVLAGAITTAVLQSSSATTVMAIGFVSAGLMNLPQAISIILGANIGTTMTAQIIAFKISDYIYVFIFVGFLISFISKSEKVKSIGQTLFAFGLLFLGIETMGGVMKPLASSPIFLNMISKVADIPILGVAVGTLMTVVVQSSSATIAVLQNFATQAGPDGVTSILGLTGAIPILLGDNIGTTITALLASVGQSKDAKRTALAHCTFNISGSLIFIWLVRPYAYLIQQISPKGPEVEVISRQIANAHTFFNLTMTILWIPFIWLLVKIVMKLVPDGKDIQRDPAGALYLDNNLISQPAAALQLVIKEVAHCGEMVKEMLITASASTEYGRMEVLNQVVEKADAVRSLSDRITGYLAELFSAGVLTEEQANATAEVMYVLSDIERIGTLCGSISDNIRNTDEHEYSEDAMKDLKNSIALIKVMYVEIMEVMTEGKRDILKGIQDKKAEILGLDGNMRKAHMARVASGKCSAGFTTAFTNVLNDIDRMGNSCVNIADALSGAVDMNYFEYLDS